MSNNEKSRSGLRGIVALTFAAAINIGAVSAHAGVTLSATGSDGKIELSWTATNNLRAVQVMRDTDANPAGRQRLAILNGKVRSYVDTSVTNGRRYWYWIKHTDMERVTDNSNAAAVTAGGGSQPISVTGVSLTPTATVKVGATTNLTATVQPDNASNKAVTWSASDATIATVSNAGVVKGVANGSATITVKTADGNRTATSAITVTAAPDPVVPNYTLTIGVSGSGTTSVSAGSHSYKSGTEVTITATPASGYVFSGWSGALTGSTNPLTLTMNGNKSLTANFKAQNNDGDSCQGAQVKANEVLWIGDSWIQIPGDQHNRVRDLARAAGTIGTNEDYVVNAVSGSPIATIVNQYNSREAGQTKVKVLIMDGGGIDTIFAGGSQNSVANVVNTFKQHLAKVASDGSVQHIIYFLYPELPTIAGVAALRPEMQQACAASAVPCHFLDLQPLWAGHPEYTGGDNIHPSSAGGKVIGDAIWAIMQKNCIAQSMTDSGDQPIAVTGVSVTPATATVTVKSTASLSTTVTPNNAANKSVSWASNNAGVATVSANGVVTGVAAGNATITARTADGNRTATSAITVTADQQTIPVTGVTMTPSATVTVGATSSLTATVQPTNASNKAVTWNSSNSNVASVSSTGVVTGVAEGAATITVATADGDHTATSAITVTPAPEPGKCSRKASACTSPAVTVSDINVGVAVSGYGQEGDTDPLPMAIAAMPSGGSRLAWLGTDNRVYVAKLDCNDKMVGTPASFPAVDLQDLQADDNGGVVLLTRNATNGGPDNCGNGNLCGGSSSQCKTMHMVRFDDSGKVEWEQQVTNLSDKLAGYDNGARFVWWYQHHGRLAFDGNSNYAAYFGTAITVNNGSCVDIHEGDRMQVVNSSGALVSRHPDSFEVGCSHAWQSRMVWDPRTKHFAMVCATDNECRIAQPNPYRTVAKGNCDGTLFGGDLVLSSTPGSIGCCSPGNRGRRWPHKCSIPVPVRASADSSRSLRKTTTTKPSKPTPTVVPPTRRRGTTARRSGLRVCCPVATDLCRRPA